MFVKAIPGARLTSELIKIIQSYLLELTTVVATTAVATTAAL